MFELRLPPHILFGSGKLNEIGSVAGPLGRRALLCTGRSALRRSGRLDRICGLLAAEGVSVTVFDGIENDPSLATCDRALDALRAAECDLVIAVGGGSVMDVGKTAAAMARQEGALIEYFSGGRLQEHAPLPFVAAPTTAGTGSECTNNAVLTDAEHGVKKSLRDPRMIPDAALVDPELTCGCPPDITAQAGMDALTQAIECAVSAGANPVTDALAFKAIGLIAGGLHAAVHDPANPAHREPVALGSLMAGMAFGNAGLGAAHGLAHPLGVGFHIPHGLICAILLPHVCAFNLPVCKERFGAIAPLLGAGDAEAVPEALAAMNRSVGIPETVAAFGVTEADFPAILANCRSGSMAKNPRAASDDDLADILRKIL